MIRAFPGFVFGLAFGLAKAALTEVEVFLLVLLGILIGIKTDAITGAIVALGAYTFFRMIGYYVALVAKEINRLSTVMGTKNSTHGVRE